ncbi:hypothetical protein EDC01DRAFT_648233 [Geopyxis carbonaria]|nr:hypothetical protein EDC01DRAFT_648233 [Geopyxis carbonaria]
MTAANYLCRSNSKSVLAKHRVTMGASSCVQPPAEHQQPIPPLKFRKSRVFTCLLTLCPDPHTAKNMPRKHRHSTAIDFLRNAIQSRAGADPLAPASSDTLDLPPSPPRSSKSKRRTQVCINGQLEHQPPTVPESRDKMETRKHPVAITGVSVTERQDSYVVSPLQALENRFLKQSLEMKMARLLEGGGQGNAAEENPEEAEKEVEWWEEFVGEVQVRKS